MVKRKESSAPTEPESAIGAESAPAENESAIGAADTSSCTESDELLAQANAKLEEAKAKLEDVKAEYDKLFELRGKFKTLYDEVRVRLSVLGNVEWQIKQASDILDKALKSYAATSKQD